MPSCNQLSTVVREEVVAGARKKGFFKRIAEKWGLAQKEVIDCRGKSLSEIARMTSQKDAVVLSSLRSNEAKISELAEKYNKLDAKLKEYREMPEFLDWRDGSKKAREELEKEIKVLNEKIEHEEWCIRYHKERLCKSDNGYSPDGDHVYGSSSGVSESYANKVLKKERVENVEPLEKELQVLLDKKAKFDMFDKNVQYYRERRAELGRQITNEVNEYRRLSMTQGVPAERIDDYLKKWWGYEYGMIRS